MSFVSVMANSEFISVVSDGRVTFEGVSEKEDYIKYIKIYSNQFIAFAGSKEPCEYMVNQIDFNDNEPYDLNEIANKLHEAVYNQDHLSGFKLLFTIGGINNRGEIEFYTVSHNQREIGHYKPSGTSDIRYAYMFNGLSEEAFDIDRKFRGFCAQIGINTANKCFRVQREINNFVADNESSVNKRINQLLIRK